MIKELENQVALVTGGGSGIGRAIAEKYAKNGAQVVILGRHEDTLKDTASAVEGKISYIVADLTKDEDIQKVADYVKESFGKLNILVNSAGWCPVQPLSEMTLADYDKAFNLDVRGVVALTIAVLPLIKKRMAILLICQVLQHNILQQDSQCILQLKWQLKGCPRVGQRNLVKKAFV